METDGHPQATSEDELIGSKLLTFPLLVKRSMGSFIHSFIRRVPTEPSWYPSHGARWAQDPTERTKVCPGGCFSDPTAWLPHKPGDRP